MKNLQKIKQLYHLPNTEFFGFSENEMVALEARLSIVLPQNLRTYYRTLGIHENINYSHNRLLKPNEIKFSDDRYLIFYEENQGVVSWGIKEDDLGFDNPPVYGNYFSDEVTDWHLETTSIDDFFLLMAVYNGTLGGLKYHAIFLDKVEPDTVSFIETHWKIVSKISSERQNVYTNDFIEVICLAFDAQNSCNGAFLGTNNQERFDGILDNLDIDWSYISYEDCNDE